ADAVLDDAPTAVRHVVDDRAVGVQRALAVWGRPGVAPARDFLFGVDTPVDRRRFSSPREQDQAAHERAAQDSLSFSQSRTGTSFASTRTNFSPSFASTTVSNGKNPSRSTLTR